jgi:hypothetical protein
VRENRLHGSEGGESLERLFSTPIAALRASSNAPSGAVNCGDSIVSAFDLFMILIYLYTLISEG